MFQRSRALVALNTSEEWYIHFHFQEQQNDFSDTYIRTVMKVPIIIVSNSNVCTIYIDCW